MYTIRSFKSFNRKPSGFIRLYGHLIITDSLLHSWEKKTLSFSQIQLSQFPVNMDTLYGPLSVRIILPHNSVGPLTGGTRYHANQTVPTSALVAVKNGGC